MNDKKFEDMTVEEQIKEKESWVTAVIEKAELDYIDHRGYCFGMTFDMDGRTFFEFFHDLPEIGKMMEAAKVEKPEDLVGHVAYVKENENKEKLRGNLIETSREWKAWTHLI